MTISRPRRRGPRCRSPSTISTSMPGHAIAAGAQLALRGIVGLVGAEGARARRLGHAVELDEVAAEARLRLHQQIVRDRRGAVGERLHAREIGARHPRRVHQHQNDGRREKGVIDPLGSDQVEHRDRAEVLHDRRARAARHRDQRDVDASDVEERHRAQNGLADFVVQARSASAPVGRARGSCGSSAARPWVGRSSRTCRAGPRRRPARARAGDRAPRRRRSRRRDADSPRDRTRARSDGAWKRPAQRSLREFDEIRADDQQSRAAVADDVATSGAARRKLIGARATRALADAEQKSKK